VTAGRIEWQLPSFPKFWAVEKVSNNFLLVTKCLSKNANLGLKKHISGKFFEAKFKILSTYNLGCWKFATACRNFVWNLECLSENCNFFSRLLFNPWRPCRLFDAVRHKYNQSINEL